MKKTHQIFLFFLLAIVQSTMVQAQNLVPNPSFEDTVFCPTGTNQMGACKYWNNFGNSPDYINSCTPTWGVPNNLGFGFQYAHSGEAMAGIVTYVWQYSPSWPNYREFIGNHFLSPLIIGQKYYLSFFVNCAGYLPGWQIIGTNKIGIRLSTVFYTECCPPSPTNWAHLYTETIITDTSNWIKISGSIIADSAYQYLNIGNFYDDNHTDTVIFGGPPFGSSDAYYYIDDVCVSTDSLYNELWTNITIPEGKNNIKIYPNPVYKYINIEQIENIRAGIKIYDAVGRVVLETTKFPIDNKIILDLGSIINGYYILCIMNKKTNYNYPLIINH